MFRVVKVVFFTFGLFDDRHAVFAREKADDVRLIGREKLTVVVGASVSLEGLFCRERLCCIICLLYIDVAEPTVVVDENGRVVVSLHGEPALHLIDEFGDCRLELVDRYNLPGHSGFEELSVFWVALDSPRDFGSLAVVAGGALWDAAVR